MHLSRALLRSWKVRVYGVSTPKERSMSTMSRMYTSPRAQKEEGSISSLFTSLSGEASFEYPARFLDLKRQIWRDSMVQSWKEVLLELEAAAEEVATRESEVQL